MCQYISESGDQVQRFSGDVDVDINDEAMNDQHYTVVNDKEARGKADQLTVSYEFDEKM